MKAALLPLEFSSKTEERYAEYLENCRMAQMLIAWKYPAPNLPLGHRCWYQPDFLVVASDGVVELHEVKGRWGTGKAGWTEDSRAKIKMAARAFRAFFRFVAVHPDGELGWVVEKIRP